MRIHCREDTERIIYAEGMNPIAFLASQMNHFLYLTVVLPHTLCSTYGLGKLDIEGKVLVLGHPLNCSVGV